MKAYRSDFENIAEIIKESFEDGETPDMIKSILVSRFSVLLKRSNLEFNRNKFTEVCYKSE